MQQAGCCLTVWRTRIEWRRLLLWNFLYFTIELAGRRLVETYLSTETDCSDCIEKTQSTNCVDVCCVLTEVK